MQPSKQHIENGTFKLIGGVWHKRCTGPAHEEPTYLPATVKYFYVRKDKERRGELYSVCRLCACWKQVKSPGSFHGYVPVSDVRHFYIEAVNRIGLRELARRTGLDADGLNHVITGKTKNVRKATLRKVMLELISIRRKNEHSISPSAARRVVNRVVGKNGVCSGCGTSLSNFTEDCGVCWERKRGRERRVA